MNRKDFIYSSVGAAVFVGMHDLLESYVSSHQVNKNNQARIIHLDLVTAISLSELKRFYLSLLEFKLLSEQANKFTIQAGETTITFNETKENATSPFYHFAFNIPENKIFKARDWQSKRTSLSAAPSHMIDTGYPDDIRHFRNWNAHSIFFWDPAGNLVEYIARHDLENSVTGEFSCKDILCASEIAFIVDNTESVAEALKSSFNLDQYRNGDANFRAMGDENGLLLVIKKGRVWESHTNISRTPGTIKTSVTIRADKKNEKWIPENYPFEINVKN